MSPPHRPPWLKPDQSRFVRVGTAFARPCPPCTPLTRDPQARADIDRSQREYFLRQQLKAIQSELGEGNELFEEIEQYRDKILKAKMPSHAEDESLRQLKKLERMHPDTAETATLRNWLDIMTELPWSKASKDNLNLKKAEKILDDGRFAHTHLRIRGSRHQRSEQTNCG